MTPVPAFAILIGANHFRSETVTEEELEAYLLALRTQLAERHALWEILQELIGRYASSFENPKEPLENMSARVSARLARREPRAKAKDLEVPLATVQVAVDRFFSELTTRLGAGEL
jgi:molybdopterin converting factor small subunit